VPWLSGSYPLDKAERTDRRATPPSATDLRRLPSAFVITAAHDRLRDGGEEYGRLLVEAGANVIHNPGVFHGLFTEVGTLKRTDEAVSDAAVRLCAAFRRAA
jgi:acetyl esterase